jgi:uncharacterized protein YndB with AHSA1/START domain
MAWHADLVGKAGPVLIRAQRRRSGAEFWSRALERLRTLAEQEEEQRAMTQTAQSPVLTREITINAAPATVHGFLTDAQKLARWMGHEVHLDARPGGEIEVNYNGFDIMRGEYVEITPQRVVMTWGWEDNPTFGPGQSTVTFELVAQGAGTLLRLTHAEVPEESRPGVGEGWDHFLGRLVVVSEGRELEPNAWAPRQAELAAGQLRRLLRDARATVAGAPDSALQRKSPGEGWTAAALAMHIVSHAGLVQFVEECISGKSEFLANATLEGLERQNAQTSAANANATRADILAAFDAQSDGAVERLRAISDEDFAKGMAVKFTPSGRITAAELAMGPLVANVTDHVASLQAALRG